MNKFTLAAVAGISILILGCNSKNTGDKYTDTPTMGKVSIAVDETFQPIIEAELPVFHAIYRYATILPKYLPEVDVFNLLLHDSVRLAIVSRPLNQKEMNYFHSRKFFPKQIPVAVDGIAVLVNPSNPDTLFSIKQLRKIMLGEITDWKQINPHSKQGEIKVVFDNPNSSTVRFVVDSITKTQKLGKQLSAMQYNIDVVDFISKTPNAIGVMGISWISDSRDPKSLSFLKKVRVAGISTSDPPTIENCYQPFQAYIATGKYPLTRFVYMILTEPRAGLGTGFTSFVASDKGQRIILKTGILPYVDPVRIVNIKKE
ncbi:MAG: substrate-binding domain-containing protein [Lentimicrobiaceae bacterium]|jgi:phosphate transport system substrate-binding protein